MIFTLSITTDNAAFCDDSDEPMAGQFICDHEVARILEVVAAKLRTPMYQAGANFLQDLNGNTVGEFEYTDTVTWNA